MGGGWLRSLGSSVDRKSSELAGGDAGRGTINCWVEEDDYDSRFLRCVELIAPLWKAVEIKQGLGEPARMTRYEIADAKAVVDRKGVAHPAFS